MIPLVRSAIARAPRSTRSYFSIRAMSKPATTAPPATTGEAKKPASVQPEGAGILIPASKVHQATKAELLGWLEREDGFKREKGGRVPRLVGVLATEKEDARSYAEVSAMMSGVRRGEDSSGEARIKAPQARRLRAQRVIMPVKGSEHQSSPSEANISISPSEARTDSVTGFNLSRPS